MMNNASALLLGSLALAIVPLLVGMCTSYVKVSIVLGLVKSALGTQNVPGPLVTAVLSLVLTIVVMGPTARSLSANFENSDKKLFTNLTSETWKELSSKVEPLRDFLLKNSSATDRVQLLSILVKKGVKEDEKSLSVLIPSFMVGELKESFEMGFLVLLPFLIIDIVVANILVGLGMFMVSPITITLPLKLLLFLMTDAWWLLIKGLILSYS